MESKRQQPKAPRTNRMNGNDESKRKEPIACEGYCRAIVRAIELLLSAQAYLGSTNRAYTSVNDRTGHFMLSVLDV
jgi:hypothetical protein